MSELLHDGFTSTSVRSMGDVIGKREYVASARRLKVCDYEMRDFSVHAFANVAVVKARLTCDSKVGRL